MRFVHPFTDTLTLPNGDTLTVRRRLNVGEQRESFAACSTIVDTGEGQVERKIDPLLVGRARLAAYLVDWYSAEDPAPSIRDLDLAGRLAVLDNLEPDDLHALKAAVDAHEARQVAARLEEKKTGPTTHADPISRSPSDAVGVSTGSGN